MPNNKIAIIRVRGNVGVRSDIANTLSLLRLYKKNNCVIVPDTYTYRGMITKVRDYVTYGNIDDETLKLLDKNPTRRVYNEILHFRLNPPKKGFGRKGIKLPFTKGGALGDRKDKINDLIRRML